MYDWDEVKKYLDTIRQRYTDIGMSGLPALQAVINPLLIRFEKGERTTELYNEIMELQ